MQIPVISRKGQNKPFGSIPRINWSHPLSQGLVSYNYDAGGILIDLVGGKLGTFIPSGGLVTNRVTSRFGTGYKYPGPGNISDSVNAGFNVKAASLLSNAPYCIAVGTLPVGTSDNFGAIITIKDVSGNFGFELQSGLSPDQFQIIYAGSTPSDERYSTAASTNTNNIYHTVVANADGASSGSVYCDGALDGTFTGGFTTISSSDMRLLLNSNSIGSAGGQSGITGFIYYVGQWARTLTASEARQLHSDPYCFLIYPEDDIFATMVGASVLDVLMAQILL